MHLAYSERDLLGVKIVVDGWKKKGFIGQLNTNSSGQGFVSITTRNWVAEDGTFVTIELHKVSDGTGFLGGQKSTWVSRLLTHPDSSCSSPTVHGCFQSPTQPHALDRAIKDVGTFLSQTELGDYLND